ncbi:MAG: histidine--tRNA ligase [Candidatus Binatia bacterium]
MADLVESKALSGFQDLLPDEALAFARAVERVTAVFRRYGYVPIDTPCIYRYETLTGGRAGIDKQLFEWRKQEGAPGARTEGEHLALRFDLTVPLARYVAANFGRLAFPFRRYDVGKVWRGERPQRGRYREFTQCDFDVVGTSAPAADLEVVLVVADLMEALDAGPFVVRLNDRAILNGLLDALGLRGRGDEVLRTVDKLDRIGEEGVRDELARPGAADTPGVGLGTGAASEILAFVALSRAEGGDALLARLADRFAGNPLASQGVDRLRFVVQGAQRLRAPERFAVDLSIARGLGYYTGTVFETTLTDVPGFGSVCSGGRYDDLASQYTKNRLPGVGGSVGLSRLLAALAGRAVNAAESPCPVLLATAPGVDPVAALGLADALRRAGIGVEVYPQAAAGADVAKIAKQMKFGDAAGKTLVVLLAPDEIARHACVVKDLRVGTQEEVALAAVAAAVRARLGEAV